MGDNCGGINSTRARVDDVALISGVCYMFVCVAPLSRPSCRVDDYPL